MAYSDFSLTKVKKEFGLTEQATHLFHDIGMLEASHGLMETLDISIQLALSS